MKKAVETAAPVILRLFSFVLHTEKTEQNVPFFKSIVAFWQDKGYY